MFSLLHPWGFPSSLKYISIYAQLHFKKNCTVQKKLTSSCFVGNIINHNSNIFFFTDLQHKLKSVWLDDIFILSPFYFELLGSKDSRTCWYLYKKQDFSRLIFGTLAHPEQNNWKRLFNQTKSWSWFALRDYLKCWMRKWSGKKTG